MGVAELAFSIQLRLAHDQALRRRDVFDHPSQKVLNKLERAYRSSELQALLGILKRSLVGAHRASRRHPGNCVARHLQNFRRVAERVTTLKTVFFRHAAIFQGDVAVLHDLERDFVLNLVNAEAGCRLVLDDETFNLIVGDIARPDDREVAPRRVADPALLAVKNPSIAVALGRGQKTARRAGTDKQLRQTDAADLVETRHWWKPLLLLLFRPIYIDRAHREAVVHTHEGGERWVNARDLHLNKAQQSEASAGTPVAFHANATDA